MMSDPRPLIAWEFLRRNPVYIEDLKEAAAPGPAEGAPFPLRRQTEDDLEAASWGLLAWENPSDQAVPASPFWIDAPTLEGVPSSGVPLTEMLGMEGVRLSGLRLRSGAVIVEVERGEASVQIRIADGAAFDPAGGIALPQLEVAADLHDHLWRAIDLWPVAGAGIKKDAAGGFRTRTFSWRSTANSAAKATA